MKESTGAIKRARDGGYIHVLIEEPTLNTAIQVSSSHGDCGNTCSTSITTTALAPLEIRDAAYRRLLDLSPAWRYERELVTAEPDGLLARGLPRERITRFGALPPRVAERDALAKVIRLFIAELFPAYAENKTGVECIGVPGFWRASSGQIKLGRDYDYKRPALVIPYRDARGRIQACQLRFAGARGGYHWLSTPEDRLNEGPHGTSSGAPIHWTSHDEEHLTNELPVLVTEGALKAEVFVALRPPMRAIAVAGVGIAHAEIIRATRGRDVVIGFDSDHKQNAHVSRQLGKLIAGRAADSLSKELKTRTRVVVWDNPKGIDEAVLRNSRLHVISASRWVKTLACEPLAAVEDVWQEFSFSPEDQEDDYAD